MQIEFQEAITRLRDRAAKLRRQYLKTKDGRYMAQANALQQLAQRIRLAVPSDPDDDDLGRIATEMLKEDSNFTAVVKRSLRRVTIAEGMAEVYGRTRYAVAYDDYQFFDRDGTSGAIRAAEGEAGEG